MKEKSFREKFDSTAGAICKALIPIREEYYYGKGARVAICTLSSLELLKEISKSKAIMDKVLLAGRLLSENKGIDNIIRFSVLHPELKSIILCGKDVKGHKAGQAFLSVYDNGVDGSGRIIGATGPYPFLESDASQVESFRKQIRILDIIGITSLERIDSLLQEA